MHCLRRRRRVICFPPSCTRRRRLILLPFFWGPIHLFPLIGFVGNNYPPPSPLSTDLSILFAVAAQVDHLRNIKCFSNKNTLGRSPSEFPEGEGAGSVCRPLLACVLGFRGWMGSRAGGGVLEGTAPRPSLPCRRLALDPEGPGRKDVGNSRPCAWRACRDLAPGPALPGSQPNTFIHSLTR